jgi:hypothetical protein
VIEVELDLREVRRASLIHVEHEDVVQSALGGEADLLVVVPESA